MNVGVGVAGVGSTQVPMVGEGCTEKFSIFSSKSESNARAAMVLVEISKKYQIQPKKYPLSCLVHRAEVLILAWVCVLESRLVVEVWAWCWRRVCCSPDPFGC